MQYAKKLGLFFLILLVIAGVGFFIVYRDAASKLASRGGGSIPTADELVYPELTDAENAAILYRAAWNTLDALPEGINDRFMSDYTDTMLARIGVADEPDQALSDSDIQVVDVLMAEADPAFDFLRQVRGTKGCLFLKDHSPETYWDNMEITMDSFSSMRTLARYVSARVIWEAEQGNADAALDWVTTGLHMANDLSDESEVVGEIVKSAIASMMLSVAQGIIYDRPISDSVPQALLDELDDLRDRRHFADAFRRDAALSEAFALADGGWWYPELALWKVEQGYYFESMGVLIRAVEEEDYDERTRMLDELWESVYQSSEGLTRHLHWLETMSIPVDISSALSVNRLIAECDLLELALSLRVYEQTYGAFPDTLADLTPEFLPAIPKDPLDGRDYVYEKSDEQVTVRSEESTRNRNEIAFHLAPLARSASTSAVR